MTTDTDDRESREGEPPRALTDAIAALRESKERYALALKGSNDGIWDWNIVTGEVFFSDRWKAIIGYEPNEISTEVEEWKTRIHPEDFDRVMAAHQENFEGKTPHFEVEYRLRHKDGSYRWVLGRGACLRDDRDVPIRAAGSHTDITARKQTEETIRKNAEHLRQVQKFEAIGHMVGGLAHHLNNLMTVVTGYSELLLTRVPEADPQHGELMKIHAAGERAAELTRQLLAFSRLQVLRPREVDVNLFISHLSTTLHNLAGRSVRFTFSPGDGVGTIQVDPDHLRRALTHLVANANDAMPGGGELRMITTAVEQVEPIAGIEPDRGRYALLTVQDSGCGMDAEARNRIFEPFYSLKSGREGMGLPSLYGFVKQSGGYIFVDSRPGDGTTFRIYFPCLAGMPAPG
ncbi:nitrogen regulation protein NR(II) [Candidatus Deferrimicrobium sp.]|uniref:two-component system sensor histidine kinase NtrB n=1 Tax=Candidatus Deferrimicrobium sp. TaxID=3060586 RepID=UPI00271F2389|nr:PAS domain-containing hybrid sensor histidine kinase/response regulator [Candidatus Deferrimicrobium sp.]MDO8737543.1 PAS domain-containing protein [Candidatus Deferrimicrobium sp.]